MTLNQLLPSLKELSHDEKVEVFEFLKKELEQEQIEKIFTEKEYHIFTPFGMEEAALQVMEALKEHNEKS